MNNLAIVNEEVSRKVGTTMNLDSKESRVKLYNGTENADVLINDIVGKTIDVHDVYIEAIPKEEVDEKTGEVRTTTKYRTILFDNKGTTYATGSYGIYNSIVKLVNMFGEDLLHTEGLKVEVVKVPTKDGKTKLSLKYLSE